MVRPFSAAARRAPFVLSVLSAMTAAAAQSGPFATQVVRHDTRNNAGGGIFDPSLLLGAPRGGGAAQGSTHVHSLGIAGDAVLGFGVVLTDGPGADFLVAENPFFLSFARSFAELAFVEVSSDGAAFARFPAAWYGPDAEPGPFGSILVGSCAGLAGATPVHAHPANPNADPQDVVEAGGEAFDLADLADHPLVRAGRVDLRAIRFVRLVDVQSGVDRDARGRLLRDAGSGSADVDAVTVIHHAGNQAPNGPRVTLRIPADGNFELGLADPDGLGDLDPASLRAAFCGMPVHPLDLLAPLTVTQLTPTSVTWRLGGPLPPWLQFQLAFSVKDRAGHRSGALRARPDGA
jgi:hypothetical protein